MKVTKIKVGSWYETKFGVGECLKVGGTFPPSARLRITKPIPRGELVMPPKDVWKELTGAELEAAKA